MQKLVSIILPIYNESENIDELISRLQSVENQLKIDYIFEYIFIDDGSSDNSLNKLKEYREKYNNIKIIKFFKNFGQQIAFKAGLNNANGDLIITIDSDLQDPPELILKMIKKSEEGFNIVYGRKANRHDGFFKKTTANIYYNLIYKLSDNKIPKDVGDFRLISKNVLEEIKKSNNKHLKGAIAFSGFNYCFIDFDRQNRTKGKTKYSLFKMLKLAIEGITTIPNILSKVSKLTIFGILISLILPFFILCFFNQPSAADDFCFASDRKTSNFIAISTKYYNNWSFRYSEGLLHYLNPIIYSNNINSYKIITPIFLILLIYSFYFFIKNLFNFSKSKNLIFALIFFCYYVLFMPSIAEGLYWFSGSFAIYQTGVILTLFLTSFFIKIIKNKFNNLDIIISSIILIILAGINEIFIFTILPLLFFIFLYLFIKNDNKKWLFFYFFIIFFLFSTFSLSAPGNFIRNSLSVKGTFSEQIISKIFFSINALKKYPIKWINFPVALISSTFFIFLIRHKELKQNFLNPIILLLLNLFIIFSGFFILNWPTVEDRTLNVIYFIFLLSLFFNLYNLSNYIKNNPKNKLVNFINNINTSNKIKFGLIILTISSILITKNNTNLAYKDILSGEAYRYNIELNDRYKTIQHNINQKLVVKMLSNKPKSIYFRDIDKSPTDWKNICYTKYFNLKNIRSK